MILICFIFRYWPFIQSGKQVAIDLDNIQANINQRTKTLYYEKNEERIQVKSKIKQQKVLIEENSSPAEEIDKILHHVNLLTVDFYQQVLQENLPQIVMDFQAPLPNYDLEVVQMYKKELLRLVPHTFILGWTF